MSKRHIKRVFKWLLTITAIPLVIVLLVLLLLYLPPIQNFIVSKASTYLAESTDFNISVGRMRLVFPLRVSVEDVSVMNKNTLPPDTLLTAEKLYLHVKLFPLLQQNVVIRTAELDNARVKTGAMIDGMSLNGNIGSLFLSTDEFNLSTQKVKVNELRLSDSDLHLIMADTTTKDTINDAPLLWVINANDISIENVGFHMDMPLDTLQMAVSSGKITMGDAIVDLGQSLYSVERFKAENLGVTYISTAELSQKEQFDPAYIEATDIQGELNQLFYSPEGFGARITQFSAIEKSGLILSSLKGEIMYENSKIEINDIELLTPASSMVVNGAIPLTSDTVPGEAQLDMKFSLGKEDLFIFIGKDIPYYKSYPSLPLTGNVLIDGNMEDITLRQLNARLPGTFSMKGQGHALMPFDSLLRSGNINLELQAYNLDFILDNLPPELKNSYTIPHDVSILADLSLLKNEFSGKVNIEEGEGQIHLTAYSDLSLTQYGANVKVSNFSLTHFMPAEAVDHMNASLAVTGKGTDFFNPSTTIEVRGALDSLIYEGVRYSDFIIQGDYRNNNGKLVIESTFKPIDLSLDASVRMLKQRSEADIDLLVRNLNLSYITGDTTGMSLALNMGIKAASDLKRNHSLEGNISKFVFRSDIRRDSLQAIVFEAATSDSMTYAAINSGDLNVKLSGKNNIQDILQDITQLTSSLMAQVDSISPDPEELKAFLPTFDLNITSGQNNPLFAYLLKSNIRYTDLGISLNSSPQTGLNGHNHVCGLIIDTIRIDSVKLDIAQDSLLYLRLAAKKLHGDSLFMFNSRINATMGRGFAQTDIFYQDGRGRTGMDFGVHLSHADSMFELHILPDFPIIAYETYRMNPANYVRWVPDREKVLANLTMNTTTGILVSLLSQDNESPGNRLKADIQNFPLKPLSNIFPTLPALEGMLNVHAGYEKSDSIYNIQLGAGVDSFSYQQKRIGDIALNLSYQPVDSLIQRLTAAIQYNKQEVINADVVSYQGMSIDSLSGKVNIVRLPLWPASMFIPNEMATLSGALNGSFEVSGRGSLPQVDGSLRFDTAAVNVLMANLKLRMDEKEVLVKDNRVQFAKYNIYASGNNPFVIDGYVDLNAMNADLDLKASNYRILDAPRNNQSIVYGKAYVDVNSTVKGALDALVVRGNVDLLGNTDLTYVMKDSPLSARDRLSGLVTFVSFSDTLRVEQPENQLDVDGLDLILDISIDQTVQLGADLSEDRKSNIEVEGGGNLNFQITPQGEMFLNGRYTMTEGKINYSLPVVPLKTFRVQEGSYIEWTGMPTDPRLSIVASERLRSSVSTEQGDGQDPIIRYVNFDLSVSVKNTLEDLNVVFDIDAPEDLAIHNELLSMTADERTQTAIYMMVTGSYRSASSQTNSQLSVNSALNSFLQSEINNLAGDLLKDTEVNFGIESNADGSDGTDYTFSFAQRFYNDRIRVVIGGRVSSGEEANNNSESFIDNVSVEYRLDRQGTRYVRVFYDKNRESLLEGEIIETGAGIVMRKKMSRLGELFIFRKKRNNDAVQN